MLLDVTCPPGVRQGEILTVQRPGDGAEFELALPAGVSPGQTFEVEVPEGQSTDFAGIEAELLAELNRARTHPASCWQRRSRSGSSTTAGSTSSRHREAARWRCRARRAWLHHAMPSPQCGRSLPSYR